ncbi:MAG TPA: hypothetical protein VKP13_17030 [Nitrospira sp.]|nr:hypothetical protein [Nitrospira sp.]
MLCRGAIRHLRPFRFLAGGIFAFLLACSTVLAVQMKDDPNGFEGIPWGTTLSESDNFGLTENAGRLKTYELKNGPQALGPATVESMKFMTIDDKFARVTVRYKGKEAHDQILAFLQSRFGPLDRTPGQFSVGPVKFYAWQGFETEITMRYEARNDSGIIFFESQTLRAKLTEGNSGTLF